MQPARLIVYAVTLVLLAGAGLAGGWLIGRSRPTATLESSRSIPAPATAVTTSTDSVNSMQSRVASRDHSPTAQPSFENVASKYGIHFKYERGETGEYWLPETMGGGVAWLDYDGDDQLDLYFVQGCQLPRDDSGRFVAALYRNKADALWEEVPRSIGPSNTGYGMGVAVGDVDNDGFDDIYVTNFGPDAFYRNNGDGTFAACGAAMGLGCPLWGTSAAFGDLDGDGDLDLFVANYVQQDPAVICTDPVTGKRKYCGPDYYPGQPNVLYENRGDGQFVDRTEASGVLRSDGKGLGVVIAHLLDEHGLPDIFVANDLRPNFLFRNITRKAAATVRSSDTAASSEQSPFQFDESAFALGAAVNAEGVREANMGIACGDHDEDGRLDLYVTHYYMEHDTLWQNFAGSFADVTKRVGLNLPTLRQLSWGTNFIDYDNDGWLDLFVTSGHINNSEGIPYAMPPQLFHNLGAQGGSVRFAEVSSRAGPYFRDLHVGRGSAAGDFNGDGLLDLVVGHHHEPAALLENKTQPRGSSIGFRFIGRSSDRSGIGCRITVTIEPEPGRERRLMREVVGGGSYLSADTREVLIGLGTVDRVKAIEVLWPSGEVTTSRDLAAGAYWTVREGEPVVSSRPFRSSDTRGVHP